MIIKACIATWLALVTTAGVACADTTLDQAQVIAPPPGWQSANSGTYGPVFGDFPAAFVWSLSNPDTNPVGANDYSCIPSVEHPRPVVLVHGTTENAFDNWSSMSPVLKRAGYCVFALNFGGPAGSPIKGIRSMNTSAGELGVYIDHVLAVTGATTVDLVGHSQGGTLPRVLLEQPGWSDKIGTVIGLAPTNNGSTGSGVLTAIRTIPGGEAALESVMPAFSQWTLGDQYLPDLDGNGSLVEGVRYVNIASRYDEVVTPYTQAFLPDATNLTVQDFCATDFTEHLTLPYDPIAQQLVLNHLDPATARTPVCRWVLPFI